MGLTVLAIVVCQIVWNRLPTDLKLLRSTASFKSELESFLVSCCLHWEHCVNSGMRHRSECLNVGGALQVTVVTVTCAVYSRIIMMIRFAVEWSCVGFDSVMARIMPFCVGKPRSSPLTWCCTTIQLALTDRAQHAASGLQTIAVHPNTSWPPRSNRMTRTHGYAYARGFPDGNFQGYV